jgi:hypothetical protein
MGLDAESALGGRAMRMHARLLRAAMSAATSPPTATADRGSTPFHWCPLGGLHVHI